jgi:hypothetical protein
MGVLMLGLIVPAGVEPMEALVEDYIAGRPRVAGGYVVRLEPCLCAQLAPAWSMSHPLSAADWIEIKAHADKGCLTCNGEGREHTTHPKLHLAWGHDTVQRLWALLGLAVDAEASMYTQMWPVPLIRRGIMLARATFDRVAPTLTREEITETTALQQQDGTIRLHAVRYYQPGLDVEGLKHRLELFASFVEAVAAEGATHVVFEP